MVSHSLLRLLRALKPQDIEDFLARDHVIRRAEQYADEGRVEEIWVDGAAVRAHVTGTSSTPYHCSLRLFEGHLEAECSCPYQRGACWHAGAVIMALAAEPQLIDQLDEQAARLGRRGGGAAGAEEPAPSPSEGGVTPPAGSPSPAPSAPPPSSPLTAGAELQDAETLELRLLRVPKARLAKLLAELGASDPVVATRLADLGGEPTDLDLRLFRQAAIAALRPGRPLARHEMPHAAADLRDVVHSIGRLVGGGQPERALDLIEEIAWIAFKRLEDADDRDAVLARLVREVLGEWVRGWEEVASRDRAQLARSVFGWLMEDAGPATESLVLASREMLGDAGLATLNELLAPALEARVASRPTAFAPDPAEGIFDPLAECLRRALREVAEARGDLDAFLALSKDDATAGDAALAAARRLAREGLVEDALRWAGEGSARARGSSRAALDDLRVRLLVLLDRRGEASEIAWQSFREHPGAPAYLRLMDAVGEGARAEWRKRALDAAELSADASAFVEVCLAAEELRRLEDRLSASPNFVLGASSPALERAASALAERAPLVAGQLRLALVERIFAEGDPRAYGHAQRLHSAARADYALAGESAAWREVHEGLSRRHALLREWNEGAEPEHGPPSA